jgi:putative Mn2+ efflux pump MntP
VARKLPKARCTVLIVGLRFWAFIGGMMLVILGIVSFVSIFFNVREPWRGASFLVVLGVFVIIVALYGAIKASQRNPRP